MPTILNVNAVLQLDFDEIREINTIILKEADVVLGQPGNCRNFTIDALIEGEWKKIHGSDVIGYYRMCIVDKIRASAVRLIINEAATDKAIEIAEMTTSCRKAVIQDRPFRVLGYYHPMTFTTDSFGGDAKQFDAVTDVVYIGFMPLVSGDDGLKIQFDANTPNHIKTLKEAIKGRDVNIYISLTGRDVLSDNDDDIERVATQAAAFVKAYDLHGVDLDIEGEWYINTVERAGYSKLIVNLGKKLHDMGKKISVAVITSYPFTVQALETLDYINTMTYDYTDIEAWHSVYSAVLRDIDATCELGIPLIDEDGIDVFCHFPVPHEKVNVGMPFYGMGNACGIREWDRTYSYGDYYQPGDEDNFDPYSNYAKLSYYNGPTTIRDKTAYALAKVGGVMVWSLSHDVDYEADYSLLKTVKQTIDMYKSLPEPK